MAGVTLSEQCKASQRFSRYDTRTARHIQINASGSEVCLEILYVTPEIAEKMIAFFVESLTQ
jgi:hypothetical protein